MNKVLEVFVLMIFMLSLASIVYAEDGLEVSGGASPSTDDVDVANETEIEAIVETVASSASEPSAVTTSTTTEGYVPQCVISTELYRKMLELEKQLLEKDTAGGDVGELKSQIEEINARIRTQKAACIGTTRDSSMTVRPTNAMPTTAVSVGRTCELSSELKDKLGATLKEYNSAIESKDFDKAKGLRAKIALIEDEVRTERSECMDVTVPGLTKQEVKNCTVPPELYEELEKARYRVSELKSLNTTIPKDLRERMEVLESKIANYKARCNALNVSDDIEESDVKRYYQQRMIEAMDTDDMDSRVQALKELRVEIDETIKNMIEQKKRLKYSEMEGVADRIEFKAGKVRVGDSETNTTEVEVEVVVDDDKNGSTVRIKPTELAVLLTQEGYNVTAEDITVNESGIYVQGILVKTLPAAVFENNKNLERNAKRMIGMKLEKEGDKAVYKTEYNVKKRVLGIIPANAKHELTIDAENGETLQEKKPWWSGLSTTVETTEVDEAVNTPAQ